MAVTRNDLGTERGGTKKVYEENRVKISFHKFPDDEGVFRQRIVAVAGFQCHAIQNRSK